MSRIWKRSLSSCVSCAAGGLAGLRWVTPIIVVPSRRGWIEADEPSVGSEQQDGDLTRRQLGVKHVLAEADEVIVERGRWCGIPDDAVAQLRRFELPPLDGRESFTNPRRQARWRRLRQARRDER